jgi:GNAT superfamily N-acetyltransferase
VQMKTLSKVCSTRPAELSDRDRIAELAGQLGYACTGQEVQERLAEMNELGSHAVFVAELPGHRIAGWIGVYVFRSVVLNALAEVSGLVVDETVRSRGIGEILLDSAEAWARRTGCTAMSVRSNVVRDRAHSFYEGQGYQVVKSQKVFRKVL